MSARDTLLSRFRDNFDWVLFVTASALAMIGVINLYSATSVARAPLNEVYLQQIYWLVGGGLFSAFVASVDYRHYERYGYFLYGFGIVTLVLVFILGREVNGSSRWIYLGPIGFQPSEFVKIFLVLALAKYVNTDARAEGRTLKDLIAPTLIAALPAALIALQPDLGTALILGLIFLSILSMLRIQRRTVGQLGFLAAIAIPTFMSFGMLGFQQKRIEAWLDPDKDIAGINWDPHHSRIAIGAGKTWGAGFMQGTQNQFRFLHEQHSDFPFPVFAEDWGFAGALLLLAIYLLLVLWSIHIASSAKDRFGAALAIGSGSLIFWHAIFNLGMVTGLLPIVGVTLPLFSYGGSSGLTVMIAIALLMNVSMRRSSLSTITFAR